MTFDRDIPILDDETDYVTWKKKVDIWKLGTNAKPGQQAAKLIMHMRGKPQEVAINISTSKIGSADGVKELITELDLLYKKDTTQSLFKAIDSFENYRRTKDEDMDTYISEFQRRYKSLKQLQANKDLYDDVILAYRLLNQASLNEEQARLVRATCTAELTFENMRKQLKRTFGDTVVNVERPAAKPFQTLEGADIKQEVFYTRSQYPESQYPATAEEEKFNSYEDDYGSSDIYWTSQPSNSRKTRAYHHNNPRYNPYAGKRDKFQQNQRPYLQRGSKRPMYSDKRGYKSPEKIVCFICQQPGHKCASCPHNSFSRAEEQNNIFALYGCDLSLPDSEEEVTFLTGLCMNKALIDTGAPATVCGRDWYASFVNSLSKEDKASIMEERTEQIFRFGDGKPVKPISVKIIPIRICGKDVFLRTCVVENDIPLLLSKQTMMKMGMVIDLQKMVVQIKDSKNCDELESTDSGHILLQISRQCKDFTTAVPEETLSSTLESISTVDTEPLKLLDSQEKDTEDNSISRHRVSDDLTGEKHILNHLVDTVVKQPAAVLIFLIAVLTLLIGRTSANLIAWSTDKAKRVVYWTFTAVTTSCTDATASDLTYCQFLSEALFGDPTSETDPIVTMTVSKQINDSAQSSCQYSDESSAPNIAVPQDQEKFRNGEINEIKKHQHRKSWLSALLRKA